MYIEAQKEHDTPINLISNSGRQQLPTLTGCSSFNRIKRVFTWPLLHLKILQKTSLLEKHTNILDNHTTKILSRNFTFSGDGKLLNRQDYIISRTQPSDWKITFVKYNNLILQFFGNIALLTYRNEITNENTHTKEVEMEYISWADIYVLENNQWKIGASHTIDFRMEKK